MLIFNAVYSAFLSATIFSALTFATPTRRPAPSTGCVSRDVSSRQRREIFNGYVNTFFVEKDVPKAFQLYVSSTYIQHNPFVASGPAPSLAFLGPIWPSQNITVLRTALDGQFGWIHYRIVGFPGTVRPTAIMDIVRFEGSCVVEHWDVIQELPANATNPLALF